MYSSIKFLKKNNLFQIAIKLKKDSVILVDQIQTIDRNKFKDKITEIEEKLLEEVERKIHLVLTLKI